MGAVGVGDNVSTISVVAYWTDSVQADLVRCCSRSEHLSVIRLAYARFDAIVPRH